MCCRFVLSSMDINSCGIITWFRMRPLYSMAGSSPVRVMPCSLSFALVSFQVSSQGYLFSSKGMPASFKNSLDMEVQLGFDEDAGSQLGMFPAMMTYLTTSPRPSLPMARQWYTTCESEDILKGYGVRCRMINGFFYFYICVWGFSKGNSLRLFIPLRIL